MRDIDQISRVPIPVEKSVRGDECRVLTSCRAGKIVPVWYSPLLREDRVSRGKIRLRFDMAETVHPLMNAVNVTAYAHLIPFSAFDRFEGGLATFNRSYMKKPEPGQSVVPFFEPSNFAPTLALYKAMGIHQPEGQTTNFALLEAYNLLVNWRRRMRSEKLPQRARGDSSLAEAFWKHSSMAHIVPDFDQAMMDGEVLLSVNNAAMPVQGNAIVANGVVPNAAGNNVAHRDYTGASTPSEPYSPLQVKRTGTSASDGFERLEVDVQNLFVELEAQGLRLSLANIEMAKKTAAFAKMRERYAGVKDDYLIDLLMDGIRLPDEALRQPILLDKKSTIFGYTERHATDGASLDVSRTTGLTEVVMNIRTPPVNTGGIILITVEIVPEQLFERQRDYFLSNWDVDKLPDFSRDFLDPEKVDVVPNAHVDVLHSTRDATFGFAPLNHVWKRSIPRIGGKFYRPNPDTFKEDRQRFWAVEQLNPALTTDFYLVRNNLPHSVFADTLADPFEILGLGNLEIVGNTVFGKVLQEDEGHYEALMDEVDTDRIVQAP